MSHDDTSWQPPAAGPADNAAAPNSPHPSAPQADRDAHATAQPRYGDYGTTPVGQANFTSENIPPQTAATGNGAASAGYIPASGTHSDAGGSSGFFWAPKPGIVPLRPLSVGDIIGGAFEALRANPKAILLPSLLILTVISLISSVIVFLFSHSASPANYLYYTNYDFSTFDNTFFELGVTAFSYIFSSIAAIILTGMVIVTVSRAVIGHLTSTTEVWQRTKKRFLALIGQAILLSLITVVIIIAMSIIAGGGGILIYRTVFSGDNTPNALTIILTGLAALIIIAITASLIIFFKVRLVLAPAALILENIGVNAGIKRSWMLTRTKFWRTFGILILSWLITSSASALLSGAVVAVTSIITAITPSHLLFSGLLSTFLTSILSAIVLPFSASVTALTYIDLRMRREGLDMALRQAAQI